MAGKAPKLFKETFTKRNFERKIIGRTHIESGKKFLLSIYKIKDGIYQRKDKLTAAEIKKLKELAKAIKKNKGSVRIVKLTVLLVIVAAVVVFSVFFKNPLMDRFIEKGLEEIFEAQVDIESLIFEPFQGAISFSALSIADKDDPYTNLLVMGETAVEFDIDELMMRRFIADRIVARNVDWGTARETSGALNPRANKNNDTDGNELGGISLPEIDPREIVRAELDNLKSIKKINELDVAIEEATSDWNARVQDSGKTLESVKSTADSVKRIDVSAVNTVDEAKKLIETVQSAYADFEAARAAVSSTANGISDQWVSLQDDRANLQAIIAEDSAYIQGKLTLPEGGVRELAAGIAEPYLQEALGKYYLYGQKALTILRRLKSDKESPDKSPSRKRRGIRMSYPGATYPSLLIRELAFSKGLSEENAGFVNYLSSDQELSGQPTTFGYSQGNDVLGLAVSGLLDLRQTARETLSLDYRSAGSDLQIEALPKSTGLGSFSGNYSFNTEFSILKDQGNGGTATVTIVEPATTIESKNEVSVILESIISSARSIDIKSDYTYSEDDGFTLNVSSSLDDEIKKGVGQYLSTKADEYKDQANDALMSALDDRLANNDLLYDSFSDLKKVSDGNLADIETYRAVLDGKKAELENRVTDLAKEKAGGVLDTVKDKIKLPVGKN